MPAQYEAIRDSYVKRGKSLKDAKRIASQTFIAKGRGGSRHSRARELAAARRSGR